MTVDEIKFKFDEYVVEHNMTKKRNTKSAFILEEKSC